MTAMRLFSISPVLPLCLLLAAPAAAQDRAWWDTVEVGRPVAGQWTRQSLHIPMRDGVRLAADVYRPRQRTQDSRLATMLHQTRYRRAVQFRDSTREANSGPGAGMMPYLQAGYAVVIVDVRGTGASFGTRRTEFSPEEVRDGWDVLDWIVAQPWSDGRVGAVGISYPGITAELLGTLGHPALKAVAPLFSIYDFYADVIRPGGIFLEPFFQQWATMTARMDANAFDQPGGPVTGVRPVDGPDSSRLLAEAIREHAGNASIYQQAKALTSREMRDASGISLDEISPHHRYDTLSRRIPIYSMGGWADGFAGASPARFVTQPSPGSRLVMGPWNHGGGWAFYPGREPVRAQFDQARELLRFFDHHVRGMSTGIEREPPVWYFTTGENRWKSAPTWPVPTRDTVVFLGTPPGHLSVAIVDSLGTGDRSRWNTILGGGAVRYRTREPGDTAGQRTVLTIGPLSAPLTLTGAATIDLWVRMGSGNATLFGYLEEVDPAGRGHHVTEGQLLVRNGADPQRLAFLPTSHQFRAGNSLRVVITRRDVDHFEVVPGDTSALWITAARWTVPVE